MVMIYDEAKDYIYNLDLDHIKNRVQKENGWSTRMVEVATGFYRNFLILCKKHEELALSPTKQIDEIWHAHILYTKEYHEMSEKVFGKYLHHQPFHEEEKNEQSSQEPHIQILQNLHQEEFGEPIYDAVYSVSDFMAQLFRNERISKSRTI